MANCTHVAFYTPKICSKRLYQSHNVFSKVYFPMVGDDRQWLRLGQLGTNSLGSLARVLR